MKTSRKLLGLSMMVLLGSGCSALSPLLGGAEPRSAEAPKTATPTSAEPEASSASSERAPGRSEAKAPSASEAPKEPAATITPTPAPQPTAPSVATQPFSLREFSLPLAITLPADAKLEASTSKDKLGGVNIDAKGLNLRVMRPDTRLATAAAAKSTLQKLAFRKASRFVTEEPNLLVFERGEPSPLHFMLWVRQGGATYVCQGEAPSAEELPAVLDVCRSIAAP
jgi:hypothetical protein